MAFSKGTSGNPKGRPRMSDEDREQREEFKRLLRTATVPALASVIEIARSKSNKDRFAACKFLIEKAYGTNAIFLAEDTEEEPIVVNIVPYQGKRPTRRISDPNEDWNEED